MKIKVDYVTNSSSEVFGVVAGQSALAAALIAALQSLGFGFNTVKTAADITEPQADEVAAEASSVAREIANAALEDAKRQEEIVKGAYEEASSTLDSAKTALERELEETRKIWEESEKSTDPTDPGPGYEDMKKQYTEYMEYLDYQIRMADYQKQMVEYEKAVKQQEFESQNEWVRQRQTDYIAVKEEKAMLQAVAKGYNQPGYDTTDVNRRLEQLEQRERDLEKTLSENNGSINYTAQSRGEIGPSQESKALNAKIIAEREAFEKAAKKADAEKRALLEADMKKNIAEYEAAIRRANRFDMATKAAEGVQFGADVAIEGLSYVTGPAGQKVKLAYTAGKEAASGVGEAMADPRNAKAHIAKGIIKASTEVVKDKFGAAGKNLQAVGADILSESLQSGIDATISGKDVLDEMGKGLTKGVFNAGVDQGLDAIKSKIPIPKGSSVDVHDYDLKRIMNNNPLAKGILRTATREAAGSQIKDAVKGAVVDKLGKEGGFVDPED